MLKNTLIKIHRTLSSQFGLDLRRFLLSLRGIPAFVGDWYHFRKKYTGKMTLKPSLHDRYAEGGITKSEYFWQDLLVARWVFEARPERHVDIGSRIDGFVAHVASFREIEVFDIRPVTSVIPGILFRQADLMNPSEAFSEYCDSLSCLHALEHFGLGRYGDLIDPNGHLAGLVNMVKILRRGGLFYLSVPIGKECVEFNANRIFDPRSLVELASATGLVLTEFTWIGTNQTPVASVQPMEDMEQLSAMPYALGIFTFFKQ